MQRRAIRCLAILILVGIPALCIAKSRHATPKTPASAIQAQHPVSNDAQVEVRLMEVYRLMGAGRSLEALDKVSRIVQEYPNFQLAQLVYGDLLSARIRPVKALGDVPSNVASTVPSILDDLREESGKRVKGLADRPRPGTIPSQFLEVSQKTRHAIAVDASRSRLYLFENRPSGLTLIADYYTSVGKAGVSKTSQGDQRTPLGVYYITSNLDPKSLKDFYGSGALPINYPNMLDAKRGKTGAGIWLHGTPHDQFSRPPKATDGCLVMANPDLLHIIESVEIGSTPVVIAPQLNWVEPQRVKAESKPFENTLRDWRNAKTEGNMDRLMSFYAADFNANGKSLGQWATTLKAEVSKIQGQSIELKDVSILRWTDSNDTMVVTFGEVAFGKLTGWTKRQYWSLQGDQWKIFFEATI